MKPTNKRWYAQAISEFTEYQRGRTVEEIAAHYGVKPRTVGHWFYRFGIRRKKKRVSYTLTPDEERWLRRNYPVTSNKTCALFLNMSVRTLLNNAQRLGLSKSRDYIRDLAIRRAGWPNIIKYREQLLAKHQTK